MITWADLQPLAVSVRRSRNTAGPVQDCQSKIAYRTRAEATRVIRSARRKHALRLTSYTCRACGLLHLTGSR